MKLIDVHAHLESVRFEKDIEEVLERAKEAGIKFIVNSGVNPETNRKSLELSEKYPIIKASFGFYPFDVLAEEIKNSQEFLRDLEDYSLDEEINWVEKHKDSCLWIGECGLDFSVALSDNQKEKQKEAFGKVIQLSRRINKPVLVHSRKAELEAIKILEEEKADRVIMHCFSGKKSLIKKCVENGWYLSVPPVITRLDHFKVLVEMVSLENLLTETDSPYLSPVAGKRNEPANVAVTIREISKIKNLSEEEVAEQIWNNWEKLVSKSHSDNL